ncbi:MAG: toxin-antitoxin system YwqK family antitoxin [Bacteroidota bacterium]
MKYTLSFLFCFFLAGWVLAQPNYSLDTVKTEKWNKTTLKIYNQNDALVEVVRMKRGEKHGVQEEYTNNEKPTLKKTFKNGKLDGECITYDHRGEIRERRNYNYKRKTKSSVLSGLYERYLNGVLNLKAHYKDSLLHGTYEEFNYAGTEKTKATYKKGLLTGEKKTFNNQGKLIQVEEYKIITVDDTPTSVLHGQYTYYFLDGKTATSGKYDEGQKTGVWIKYRQNGVKESEVLYKNDKRHGAFTNYHTNGNVRNTGSYYEEITLDADVLRNINDGKHEHYYESGELKRVEHYDMGKKTGRWVRYHENGQISEEKHYQGDLQIGKHENWNKDGSKIYETNYKLIEKTDDTYSVRNGKEKRWKNGVLVSEVPFKNGVREGIAKNFTPSGELVKSMEFKNDMLHGAYKTYHPNGKVKMVREYRDVGASASKVVGWQREYDANGLANRYFYMDSMGKNIYKKLFEDGKVKLIQIQDAFQIEYFPGTEIIKSFVFKNRRHRDVLSQHYFMNGKVRKITFQNPYTFTLNHADFMSNGAISNIYGWSDHISDSLLADHDLVEKFIENIGNLVKENDFFEQEMWDGNYVLKFANGQTFMDLNFKEGILDGELYSYAPMVGDTTTHMRFDHFKLKHHFLNKFAGIKTTYRETYYEEDSIKVIENYTSGGIPIKTTKYKNEELFYTREHHKNGEINYERDESVNSYFRYDVDGNLLEKDVPVHEGSAETVKERFFLETLQLKTRQHYKSGKLHGLSEHFFASGDLQYKINYKNGKKHGEYIAYNEEGKQTWKGVYVEDNKDGMWLKLVNDKIDTLYFENGRIILEPTFIPCKCYDTIYRASDLKYVPLLKGLMDYSILTNNMPNYLKPVDSLNYNSLFYSSLQFDNNRNAGFASFSLIMFDEFSIAMPSDEQIKITMNPCSTPTYLDRMNVNAHYTSSHPVEAKVSLFPERISLTMLKGPLTSNDPNYNKYTVFFDVERISTGTERFSVDRDYSDEGCFIDGRIQDFFDLKVLSAKPLVFENPNRVVKYKYIDQMKVKSEELDNFFGLFIDDAELKFPIEQKERSITIESKSEAILAGGNFVSGVLKIDCEIKDNGDYYFAEHKLTLSEKELKMALIKNKLTRIDFQYDAERNILNISFFAE